MKTKTELAADMTQFYGTEAYHRIMPGVVLTDGAKYVFTETETLNVAMDIARMQPDLKHNRSLRQAQFWRFERTQGKQFRLVCTNGNDDATPAITKDYDGIECPLDEFKIFVMPNDSATQVMLLPTEY